MKIIYKPFAVIAALIAARIGRSIFKALWSAIDDAEPPKPSAPNASFGKVVGAAALEGVTMASVAAAADRASAKAFYHRTRTRSS
jgi:hypothetical protein